jgi:outer membrane protein
MKKIPFLFLLLLSITVSAQTDKGSFMVGGSATMSLNKNDWNSLGYTKSTTLNLSPVAGYFFVRNFSAGLYLPLERSWSKSKSSPFPEEYHGDGYSTGFAPFVRYYIPVKSFFVVTEGSYGWYYSKHSIDRVDFNTGAVIGEQETTTKYKAFSFAAGPAFFLSSYTSIEVLVNYQRSDFDSMDQSMFFVTVGFQIYLPSKLE